MTVLSDKSGGRRIVDVFLLRFKANTVTAPVPEVSLQ